MGTGVVDVPLEFALVAAAGVVGLIDGVVDVLVSALDFVVALVATVSRGDEEAGGAKGADPLAADDGEEQLKLVAPRRSVRARVDQPIQLIYPVSGALERLLFRLRAEAR